MTARDDDPLAGLDLDAWQPPAAPDGLADAVIRRMREPAAVPAHEPHDLVAPPRRRWWWLGAGAVATAAAAAFALAPWSSSPSAPSAPPTAAGDVVAARAAHLDLGATSAELDAGTALHWQRDHRRITVTQSRGAATWRAGTTDQLIIDAGAMGASVEASGASLRVEVQMHLTMSDARVVAASTVTAAAVALVTVIVYQGHVKVSSGGQTVNVAPGGSVGVKPGEPPRELADLIAAKTLTPDRDATAPAIAGITPPPPPPPAPPGDVPATLASRNVAPSELEARRTKGTRNILPDEFDKIAMQGAGESRVIVGAKLCVDAAGKITQVRILRSSGYPGYDQKIATGMQTWEFDPVIVDGKPVAVCTAVNFFYSQH